MGTGAPPSLGSNEHVQPIDGWGDVQRQRKPAMPFTMRTYTIDDATYRSVDNLMTEIKSYLDHRSGSPIDPGELLCVLRALSYGDDCIYRLDHPEDRRFRSPRRGQRYPIDDEMFRQIDATMAEIKTRLNSVTPSLLNPDELIVELTGVTDKLYLWNRHNNPLTDEVGVTTDPADPPWPEAESLGIIDPNPPELHSCK